MCGSGVLTYEQWEQEKKTQETLEKVLQDRKLREEEGTHAEDLLGNEIQRASTISHHNKKPDMNKMREKLPAEPARPTPAHGQDDQAAKQPPGWVIYMECHGLAPGQHGGGCHRPRP